MARDIVPASERPIINFHKWGITVLCPIGHHLTGMVFKNSIFAGSSFEANIGSTQAGFETLFVRMARDCKGYGHAPGEELPRQGEHDGA